MCTEPKELVKGISQRVLIELRQKLAFSLSIVFYGEKKHAILIFRIRENNSTQIKSNFLFQNLVNWF